MNKVYNSQNDIASEMKEFLLKSNPNIRNSFYIFRYDFI